VPTVVCCKAGRCTYIAFRSILSQICVDKSVSIALSIVQCIHQIYMKDNKFYKGKEGTCSVKGPCQMTEKSSVLTKLLCVNEGKSQ